jgi:hypothetical protein
VASNGSAGVNVASVNRSIFYRVGAFSPSKRHSDVISSLVDSADVTVWAESLSDSEPGRFYVEIRVSQMEVQATDAVERTETLSWKEGFFLYV